MDLQPILDNGIAVAILIALYVFVDRRLWPWFTKEFWPARVRQTEAQVTVLGEIRVAVVAFQTLAAVSAEEQRQVVRHLQDIQLGQAEIISKLDHIDEDVDSLLDVHPRSNPILRP